MEEIPSSSDLALLHRFEPVIRFTKGEKFFPFDVERYISECSLWVKPPDEPAQELIPQGDLNITELVKARPAPFNSIVYLKFIEPLDLIELTRYRLNQAVSSLTRQKTQEVFRAGHGRLARVGYASRFVDALFSLTLFWRGRVPGDTAAAAALTVERLQEQSERHCYYGRVTRQNGWVVLQYWFFYPFNNWRSGFFGVNDHEGDWEMITVYAYERFQSGLGRDQSMEAEHVTPLWVAYASHDFSGDDLRRRWDDPELERVGDHPVVYAGAGSHASYFQQGEYMAELELPFLSPLVRLADRLQDFWVNVLRQAGSTAQKSEFNVFRIPFVDYARGDGLSIGPGQEKGWDGQVLDESVPWAMEYRGLWGLFAQDPISGENAPAGPVYNRNGSVRRSWYDPLGWAGLDKIPPPSHVVQIIQEQQAALRSRSLDLETGIQTRSASLVQLGLELQALQESPHLSGVFTHEQKQTKDLSGELNELRRELSVVSSKIEALGAYEQKVRQGDWGSPRAHIHRSHHPVAQTDGMSLIVEVFSALSVGILMIGLVIILQFASHYLLFGLAGLIGVLIFLEAGFRRQLPRLINSLAIGLAVVSALVLVFQFFWPIVIVGVLSAGLFIMVDNIMELRR